MKIKTSILSTLCVVVILAVAGIGLRGSAVTAAAIYYVQQAGSLLPQRPILNCSTNITCTDDAGNNRTNIVGSAGGGGYATIQNNGVSLPQETVLNFINGGCVDNSGVSTDCTFSGGGGGTGAGGLLGFSSTGLVLPTAGTTFIAPVGGAIASTTESNVSANAPSSSIISKMFISLSLPPGTGNSVVFTYRDAGVSTPVTCTISGATATSCNDSTHTFTPTVGDALAIQVVTTGTVVIAPNIKIIAQYGIPASSGSNFITVPPVTANWSNIGTGCTVTTPTGVAGATIQVQFGAGASQLCGQSTPVAAGDFSHILGITTYAAQQNFNQLGVAFTDGTKVTFASLNAGTNPTTIYSFNVTNLSGAGASQIGFTQGYPGLSSILYRLSRTGSTNKAEFSADLGNSWITQFTDSTVTASALMFYINPQGAAATSQITLYSYN